MIRWMWRAILALLLIAFVPAAFAQDVLLATDSPTGTQVYVRRAGNALELYSLGPPNMVVAYDIDVNDNKVVDDKVDIAFGQIRDGVICPQYRISENAWTGCGAFRSAATLVQQNMGSGVMRRFTIPVSELSTNGRTFGYRITFWNSVTKERRRQSGTFSLQTGRPVTATAPSPRPTSAPRPTPSPTPARTPPASGNCTTNWRTVNDSVAGAVYEMNANTNRSYFIAWGSNLPSSTLTELEGGQKCATFSAAVWYLGNNQLASPQAFFESHQADAIKNLTNGRIIYSRSRQIGGYPAREYQYTFTTDFFAETASHRTLLVARGNRILLFNAVWSGEKAPYDVDRSFNSIQLTAGNDTVHILSLALLEEAMTKYWMFPSPGYKYETYFSPATLARVGRTRDQDAVTIKAFGYPREFAFVRNDGRAKVFRVRHDNAVVEWTVEDDGKVLTAIRWRRM